MGARLSYSFFFPSRRRHTRYWRDWSSDVCSSDLVALMDRINPEGEPGAPLHRIEITLTSALGGLLVQPDAAITRYNYQLVGNYKLVRSEERRVGKEGRSRWFPYH